MATTPPVTRYSRFAAATATGLVLLLGWLVPALIEPLELLVRNWVPAGAPFARPAFLGILEICAGISAVGFMAAVARGTRGLATVAAIAVAWGLVILEIVLLTWGGLWAKLVLPAIALLVGSVVRATMGTPSPAPPRKSSSHRAFTNVSVEHLRTVALNLQKQGQLDLAFETYRRIPLTADLMDSAYALAEEFGRRKRPDQAREVFAYLANVDPKFRDVVTRARGQQPGARTTPARREPTPRPSVASVPQSKPELRPEPTPKPKLTLGRYEIERELGQGAMGTVYLGRDPKINRVVAIKAISLALEFEDADLEEVKARFFREAEMAGRLNHPGIVTVYDAGEDHGLAYIAMEYLRGRHLSYFAETENLLPPAKVLELIARLADALNYAHRQNVVHRDIKPANIMFDPDTDELKITDFGIARLTDASRTKTGIVLGTPSFMSPEQLEGRSLDGRSDLFALGVSLYHLLAGQLPFRAGSMTQLMHKIANESHAPLSSVRADLPASVDDILDRTLAKAPEDRYDNGVQLAAALRACAQQLAS